MKRGSRFPRLNDYKAQEDYFAKIWVRFQCLCGELEGVNGLGKLFDDLTIQEGHLPAKVTLFRKDNGYRPDSAMSASTNKTVPALATTGPNPPCNPLAAESLTPELQLLQTAMRKLKEAIISSNRIDEFARDVYMYIIRAMIVTKNWESYMPAILHLLLVIDRRVPMASHQRREFAAYWALDLACRQCDLEEAFRVQYAYTVKDEYVGKALIAVAKMDAWGFWRMRERVRGPERALMSWFEEAMRVHAMKGVAKTYFTVDRRWLERSVGGKTWEELVAAGCGWELSEDGRTVTVRRPKAKSAAATTTTSASTSAAKVEKT